MTLENTTEQYVNGSYINPEWMLSELKNKDDYLLRLRQRYGDLPLEMLATLDMVDRDWSQTNNGRNHRERYMFWRKDPYEEGELLGLIKIEMKIKACHHEGGKDEIRQGLIETLTISNPYGIIQKDEKKPIS
ncbi:hypothetical protein M0R04_01755 [Candidatus Dojkabacteria bacterium]|jgi:hypothetical protein|nr:hypothetical protein [Candidatus Dojkabacteria bacterium]